MAERGSDWSSSLDESGVSVPDVFRDTAFNWACCYSSHQSEASTEQLEGKREAMLTELTNAAAPTPILITDLRTRHHPPAVISKGWMSEIDREKGKCIKIMFPNTVNCMRCLVYKTKHLERNVFKRWTHHTPHMLHFKCSNCILIRVLTKDFGNHNKSIAVKNFSKLSQSSKFICPLETIRFQSNTFSEETIFSPSFI